MTDFCVLEYLYRDAANWKTYGEALLSGSWSGVLARQLDVTLGGDRLFIAEEVGLPSLRGAHAATYGCDAELDHGFHEFVQVRPASASDLSIPGPIPTVEDMVRAFAAASGQWELDVPRAMT